MNKGMFMDEKFIYHIRKFVYYVDKTWWCMKLHFLIKSAILGYVINDLWVKWIIWMNFDNMNGIELNWIEFQPLISSKVFF